MATEPGPSPPLHIVLVNPEIAANTGAIGRTCVAVGAKLWLVRPLGFHLDDRRRRRAGLDYWEHLDWTVVDDPRNVEAALETDRIWLFETGTNRQTYTDVTYQVGDALVFGSESKGLPSALLTRHHGRVVTIPVRPEARSLNLSSCVAIGAYEAMRQFRSTNQ